MKKASLISTDDVEALDNSFSTVDFTIKVVCAGEAGVGKTSMVRSKEGFDSVYKSTICFEHSWKNFRVNEKVIRMQIWDTSGQELYRSLINKFYRDCHVVIIVFAVDNMESFEKCEMWLKEIKSYADNDTILYLVGNKNDNENRVVSKEKIDSFMSASNIECYKECSAKRAESVDEVLKDIIAKGYNKFILPKVNSGECDSRASTRNKGDDAFNLKTTSSKSGCNKECLCCGQ